MTRTHTPLEGLGPGASRSRARAHEVGLGQAGARFVYGNGAYELILKTSRGEARAALRAEPEFALVIEEPLVLLGYRFGPGRPWALAPFAWQDLPRREQTPPLNSDDRALLAVEVREPGDDRPCGARNLTLSLDFSRALNDAVREQARMAPDPRLASLALTSLRRRYPKAQDLLARAVAWSTGSP